MSEVIDLIHRLSYEVVGTENLKNVVSDLKQQAANIELLKAKLADLNKAYATETNVKAQQNLSGQILLTTDAINKETAALTRKFRETKGLQEAMTVELGIIQKLTDRINDLRYARERATNIDQIKEVNAEMSVLKKELADLQTVGGEGGSIFSQLFGIQGVVGTGKQIFQGLIAGLGLGSALSIIPSLVSTLTQYISVQLDAQAQAEKLASANEALAGSFAEIEDSVKKVIDLEKILIEEESKNRLGIDVSVFGYKRKEDALKALGVVQGEVFEAEQKQFEQAQKRRELERQDLDKTRRDASYLQEVINASRDAALRADDGTSNVGEARAKAVRGIVDVSFLPRSVKEELKLGIGKSLEGGADILDVLDKQLEQFKAKRIAAEKDVRLKEDEIANAAIERQAKINAEIFQLDLKLKKELAAANEKYQQDRIRSEVVTADNIVKSIESETDFRLSALNKEREEARKRFALKGEQLPAELENDFSQKGTLIKKEQQLKQLEQLRAYYNQQVILFSNLQTELLQAQLKSGQTALGGLSPLDISGNLDQQRANIETETQLLLSANSAKYSLEVRDLEKLQAERTAAGKTETEEFKITQDQLTNIYKEFAQNEQDIIRSSNIKKLNEYGEYYSKFIKLVKDSEAAVTLAIGLEASREGGAIRGDKGFNFLSKQSRLAINQLQAEIKIAKQSVITDTEALEVAKDRLDKADKNRGIAEGSGDSVLIQATIQEQEQALSEVNRLSKKIQDAENKSFDDSKKIRKIYFDEAVKDYQILSNAAVSAYRVIAEARDRDLQHEVSVRTQRVDLALKLAERGNTVALAQEQKALEQANQQKRQAALRDQQINAALTVSNALVAVAKAAAEGGVAAPATIALALAAIGIGFAQASALANSQKTTGYFKGGYTGDGDKYDTAGVVHKGEFVFTKETTAKHRDLFEAIHKGYDPLPVAAVPSAKSGGSLYATKGDFKMLGDKLDVLIGKEVNVSQNIDKSGVHQMVVEQQRAHSIKWA